MRHSVSASKPLWAVVVSLVPLLGLWAQEGPKVPGGGDRESSAEKSAGTRPTDKSANAESTDFVRYLEAGSSASELQTAVVRYERNGVVVDLLSAVHIADPPYYDALEKRFRTYDHLLYELIKPKGKTPKRGGRGGNPISSLQRGITELLDLEFQLDAIDYTTKNFVHADLDAESFARLQRERKESLLSLMLTLMRAELSRAQRGDGPRPLGWLDLFAAFTQRDRASGLKRLFASQLESMEGLIAGVDAESPEGGSVIITERNSAAMRVLREKLEAGQTKLGVFYGAAHMPDFEKRLLAMGYKRARVEWLTAWTIAKDGASATREAPPEARGQKDAAGNGPAKEEGTEGGDAEEVDDRPKRGPKGC